MPGAMILLRPLNDGSRQEREPAMDANTIFAPDLRLVLAHARVYEQLAETAIEKQRANATRERRPNRIAAAVRTMWQAITTAADSTTTTLPRLDGYPYRS